MEEKFPKVTIAMISNGEYSKETLDGFFNQDYPNYDIIFYINKKPYGDKVFQRNHTMCCTFNRNKVKEIALKNDAKYVLIVDIDVIIPKDAIRNLVMQAESNNKGIFAGWVNYKNTDNLFFGGKWVGDNTFVNYKCVENYVTSTDFIPLGCALFPVEALKNITFKVGDDKELTMPEFSNDKKVCGENLTCSIDLQDLGYKLFLDGSVRCSHIQLDEDEDSKRWEKEEAESRNENNLEKMEKL